MKSITPVVSIILLIVMTLVAAGGAFFFVNSNVANLQSQGNLDTYPGMDNSKLNLVSVTGSKSIVRNDGSSPVTDLVIFVNGELLQYTLSEPILPGELREITYNARQSGEDLEILVIYNQGKIDQATSPASINTPESGFVETPLPLNPVLKYYETSFEELESNMMGELNDTYFYSGNYSITSDGFPGFYPFEIEEIVNISFYSYIPSGDYAGYSAPFFTYFNIISLDPPITESQELRALISAESKVFVWVYYEQGSSWPEDEYDNIDYNITYGEWFKIDIDVLNNRLRFNEGPWQSINITLRNANSIMLTEFFSDDFKIWYYSYD